MGAAARARCWRSLTVPPPAGHPRQRMSKPPPQRVRVTKLQEAQVEALVAIDRACKEGLQRAGVAAADCPARSLSGFVALTKVHDVLVADADGVVAGYVAWRDESPGVAYLEDIEVLPELQRLRIGRRLLDEVRERARGLALPVLITRCWEKAASARALFARAGFVPPDASPSERMTAWREEQQGAGPLTKEGQIVLYESLLP
jgi:ribosomal protein S18 acetylase RimI-like enzyme